MAGASVSLDRVSYAYPDGTVAVQEVSLEIAAGESLGLLGPNGAGKSTLLLQINGLLRGTGGIQVGGVPLNDRTLSAIRGKVGFLFQNPDDQLFLSTVHDDVAFGPRTQGLREEVVCQRVEAALREVDMLDFAHRPPHHLSLGQKKRVALATVLAMECEVLVLDEPTSGLDPRGRRDLARCLASLDQTQIVATHDLEFALQCCARAAVLAAGQIVAEGRSREVLADARLMERSGLEVPYTLRFTVATPSPAGRPHGTRG
jgi:cobalt transport protein ATP-binding subunit